MTADTPGRPDKHGVWSNVLPYTALVVTAACWGGNWIAARGVSEDISGIALSFLRWLLAAAIYLPFTARALWRERRVFAREWRRLAVLGAISIFLFNVLGYYGVGWTTAINAALQNVAVPIIVILVVWVGFGKAADLRQFAGIAIGSVGVIVIIFRGDLALLLGLQFNIGDVLVFFAMVLWAIYSVLIKERPSALSPPVFLSALMIFGLAWMAPFYAIDLAVNGMNEFTPKLWTGLIYLAVFPAIVAYLGWNYGVVKVGAERASLTLYLVPLFAAAGAIVILGERLAAFHAAGGVLIVFGIYVATAKRPLRRKKDA